MPDSRTARSWLSSPRLLSVATPYRIAVSQCGPAVALSMAARMSRSRVGSGRPATPRPCAIPPGTLRVWPGRAGRAAAGRVQAAAGLRVTQLRRGRAAAGPPPGRGRSGQDLHAGVFVLAQPGAGGEDLPQRVGVVVGPQRVRLGPHRQQRPAVAAAVTPTAGSVRWPAAVTVAAGQAACAAAASARTATVPGTHSTRLSARPVHRYS